MKVKERVNEVFLIFNAEADQNYRKVIKGKEDIFEYRQSGRIKTIKAANITTYSDPIYITDNAKIKPKAIKQLNSNVNNALKSFGIAREKKPIIVITGSEELESYGLFDAITNTAFFRDSIANDEFAKNIGGIGVTEKHEMWHLMQAEDFRKSVGTITQSNYGDYLNWIQPRCKKRLDNLGVTRENIREFGSQPAFMYSIGRYDEAEAEFMAKRGT